jgi:hypothetical protein
MIEVGLRRHTFKETQKFYDLHIVSYVVKVEEAARGQFIASDWQREPGRKNRIVENRIAGILLISESPPER